MIETISLWELGGVLSVCYHFIFMSVLYSEKRSQNRWWRKIFQIFFPPTFPKYIYIAINPVEGLCLQPKVKVLVAQSCPTLLTPWIVALQAPLFHGNFQARILEWVAIPFSRGSSLLRDETRVLQADSLPSEPPGKPSLKPKWLKYSLSLSHCIYNEECCYLCHKCLPLKFIVLQQNWVENF